MVRSRLEPARIGLSSRGDDQRLRSFGQRRAGVEARARDPREVQGRGLERERDRGRRRRVASRARRAHARECVASNHRIDLRPMTAPATLEAASAPSTADVPGDSTPTRAMFTNVTRREPAFAVYFNPVTLQITLANTLEEKGSGQDKKQYVSKSSAKLTMDLIFDSTDTGADVRS